MLRLWDVRDATWSTLHRRSLNQQSYWEWPPVRSLSRGNALMCISCKHLRLNHSIHNRKKSRQKSDKKRLNKDDRKNMLNRITKVNQTCALLPGPALKTHKTKKKKTEQDRPDRRDCINQKSSTAKNHAKTPNLNWKVKRNHKPSSTVCWNYVDGHNPRIRTNPKETKKQASFMFDRAALFESWS